jgi:hypothetical protein
MMFTERLTHCQDMLAHGARGALAVAAQDGGHNPVVLQMRLGETPERAELRATERLYACSRRHRQFGEHIVNESLLAAQTVAGGVGSVATFPDAKRDIVMGFGGIGFAF